MGIVKAGLIIAGLFAGIAIGRDLGALAMQKYLANSTNNTTTV